MEHLSKKTMSNKQSSIEWLYNNIKSHFEHDGDLLEVVNMSFEQAKEMHKEEVMEFVYSAVRKIFDEDRQNPFNLEKYYNETFGGNNDN